MHAFDWERQGAVVARSNQFPAGWCDCSNIYALGVLCVARPLLTAHLHSETALLSESMHTATGLNGLAHKPSVSAAHIVRTVIGLACKSFAGLRTAIGSRSTSGVFGTCTPVPPTIADISACRTPPRFPQYAPDSATSAEFCPASLYGLSRGSLCVMALRFDTSLIIF